MIEPDPKRFETLENEAPVEEPDPEIPTKVAFEGVEDEVFSEPASLKFLRRHPPETAKGVIVEVWGEDDTIA